MLVMEEWSLLIILFQGFLSALIHSCPTMDYELNSLFGHIWLIGVRVTCWDSLLMFAKD